MTNQRTVVRAPSRRRMTWIDNLFSVDLTTGGQTVQGLLAAVSANDMVGRTLTRTILCLDYNPPIDIPSGRQNVFMGIGIASQDAFLGSVTPDPETEADQPMGGWIYRCRHTVSARSAGGLRIDADIRSQRKIQTGELYMVITNLADEGVAFTINIRCLTRTLWRLP